MEYGTIGPGWESWHALTPCLEATDKYHPGGPELHALELFNRKESNPSDRQSYEARDRIALTELSWLLESPTVDRKRAIGY